MVRVENFIGPLFFTIGIICLAGALFFYNETRSFLSVADSAQGTVTELHYTPRTSSSEDSSGDVYNPIVEFRAQDGMEYSFRHTIGSNPASYSVGEEVEVLYDPAKPEDSATINSFASLYLGSLILGFMGAIFSTVGALASRFLRKKPYESAVVPEQPRQDTDSTVQRN